ncbi:MAG: hypothetical protein DLM59_08755 [Pseudonocardiales bacterium]|nr:MAG: hypothetical protein DLM59_08755 [Pseudonocardiales bacterium]
MRRGRPRIEPGAGIVLFSSGTLQQPEVQLSVFGTHPPGRPDEIRGYRLEWLTITDPRVVEETGGKAGKGL